MPNYCSNSVCITGDPVDIKEFYDRVHTFLSSEDNDGYWGGTYYTMFRTMQKFYSKDDPTPFDVYSEYGSKWWDVQDYSLEDSDCTMYMNGDSAWSPVLQLMEKLAVDYNFHITISYCEPGMNFAGECEYDNTGCITEVSYTCEEYDYLEDKDYFFDSLMNRVEYYDTEEEFNDTFSDTYELLINKYKDYDMVNKIKENIKEYFENTLSETTT